MTRWRTSMGGGAVQAPRGGLPLWPHGRAAVGGVVCACAYQGGGFFTVDTFASLRRQNS